MIARALKSAGRGKREASSGADACRGSVESGLSGRVRFGLSVVLALHLIAIASAPLAMEPASLLGQRVFGVFRPYLDAAFLNHGYHFFAPEPGPSHLIRYELTFADDRTEQGTFPDPARYSPRLNYHRHFMLSEFANRLAVVDSQKPALETLSKSFADHLMSEHGAESVSLFLRRHYIPSPEQVAGGLPLDAAELYAERSLGVFQRERALGAGRNLTDARQQVSGASRPLLHHGEQETASLLHEGDGAGAITAQVPASGSPLALQIAGAGVSSGTRVAEEAAE